MLAERQRIGTIYFMMSEENVTLQLRQPWIKFGTDAGGHDPEKATGLVHPRSYGTYPRILGKYVREEKVLPLEDAVRKMTSAVAARLSIRDRGLLREGFRADVVIFDPETIGDRATYEEPHQTLGGRAGRLRQRRGRRPRRAAHRGQARRDRPRAGYAGPGASTRGQSPLNMSAIVWHPLPGGGGGENSRMFKSRLT